MKHALLTLFISLGLHAQHPMMQMDESQMNAMMAQMQQMQACMSKIDFTPLSKLEGEASSLEKEINTLCKNNQRDLAQQKAIAFSKKVLEMKAIKEMKACTKDSPLAQMISIKDPDYTKQHICDGSEVQLGVPSHNRINW